MAESTNPSMDLSALTPKQQDMALARSPAAGQEMNALNMQRTNQNAQIDSQRKGLADRQAAERQGMVSPIGQGASGGQAAGQMQRNLSSFSNRVAAKMNQFLSGGDVSQLALDLPDEARPTWDPATEQWVVPELGQDIYDTSSIAQQKAQQAAALKEEFSPYMSYSQIGDQAVANAKSFEDVLKQFADLDNDGQIDPEEQKYLDESFQIAQMIRRLEKTNPNSPEAAALRAQLEMMDDQGLVSGIYRALDQYQRISGEAGKGPTMYGGLGGDDLNLENILNMTTQSIEQELLKTLTGQESFFGGDFESELTSNRLRTNLEKSLAFDAETRNAFSQSADTWATETAAVFQDYREKIQEGLSSAAGKIPAVFERLRAEAEAQGETTEPIDAALQWFDDITQGGNDPAEAMYQLLSDPDNGLALDQRKMIANWIGSMTGDPGAAQAGILVSVMSSLANKGYIETTVKNDKGEDEQITVAFSDQDRMKMAQILSNKNLTEQQKSSAVNQLVETRIEQRLKSVGSVAAVQQYVAEGNLEAGVNAFVESLVKSLNTYSQSATGHFYDVVMQNRAGEFTDGMPEGGDARDYSDPDMVEQIQVASQDMANAAREQIVQAVETVLPEVERTIARATNDLTELDAITQSLNQAEYSALQTVKNEITNAITLNGFDGNTQLIMQGIKGRLVAEGKSAANVDWGKLEDYVRTFTAFRNINWMLTQGDDATKEAMKNAGFTTRYANFIEDPMSFLKGNYPITADGTVNHWAVSSAINIMNNIQKELQAVSQNVYSGQRFAQAVQAKRADIENARQAASDHIAEANQFAATLRGLANDANNMVEKMRIFNPQEIADVAMAMARAGEQGYTGLDQFVDMSEYNLSKDDFEKIVAGDTSVRPIYGGSAVKDMTEGLRYKTLVGPSEDTALRDWATPAPPTPPPAPTGRHTDEGGWNIFQDAAEGMGLTFGGATPKGPSAEEVAAKSDQLYNDVVARDWNHPALSGLTNKNAVLDTYGTNVANKLQTELVASGPAEIYRRMMTNTNGKPLPATVIGQRAAEQYLKESGLEGFIKPNAIDQGSFGGDYFKYTAAKMAGIQPGESAATAFKKLYELSKKLAGDDSQLSRKLRETLFKGW